MPIMSTGGTPSQYPVVQLVGANGTDYDPPVAVRPANHNLLAWSGDPAAAWTPLAATLGFVILSKVPVPRSGTITNLYANVQVAGATLTSGQTLAGVYSSAGVKLGETANMSATWNSVGTKTMPVVTPFAVTGGDGVFIWVALLANGTTAPQFSFFAAGPTLANVGLTVATCRGGYFGAGSTSLPASFTPANITAVNYIPWTGVA